MLEDPRIIDAERTGNTQGGVWAGTGGIFTPIKNPPPSGNSGEGKKEI